MPERSPSRPPPDRSTSTSAVGRSSWAPQRGRSTERAAWRCGPPTARRSTPHPVELASLTKTIADVVPRYRAALDGVASSLVTEVNALHTTGYDLAGTTGLNFFDPANTTAATLSLSADVAGQPGRVAAGAPVFPGPTAPGPFDGELARDIAAIAERASGPDSDYRSLVNTLGLEVRNAIRSDDVQAQVALAAANDAESVGGVSIDEEMANLMVAQRAYEASARVMTVVDDLLGVLMRTGVVGR